MASGRIFAFSASRFFA